MKLENAKSTKAHATPLDRNGGNIMTQQIRGVTCGENSGGCWAGFLADLPVASALLGPSYRVDLLENTRFWGGEPEPLSYVTVLMCRVQAVITALFCLLLNCSNVL